MNDFAKLLPGHRGLQMEEKLLFDQSHPGLSGVDLPDTEKPELRTGLPARAEVGLPEVSEPQVVRHFVRLSQMNYSIDTGLFPLGSCTMKHNPRLNEKLARLPGFADLHPLQPEKTTQGALELIHTLQNWLAELCGLPGVTLNPAAGAHGELTGMMMIKKALEAAGDKREIVLVSDSAHGTNPATARTCGYKVVTVASGDDGQVDYGAFKEALSTHGKKIAAFMITNPNTCGLFEKDIQKIAADLHAIDAYFYCDGANFNAIVGKAKPGELGVDVMQFNLHKTFSTPHGGGGPGCGPVAVAESLRPHLPTPHVVKDGSVYRLENNAPESIGRIKAFHGHFGMMVRALAYMMSHGGDGLKQVAEDAVLNANYILHHLREDYHAPYSGYCMHECLLSDKKQKKQQVTTLDLAKGLIEHGFHPMTVYFPLVVPGAMLIEPTETENLESLNGFIATMRQLAKMAETEETAEKIKHMPFSTPRRRLDEVGAARKPILRYQK